MNLYTKKVGLIALVLVLSVALADLILTRNLPAVSYFGVLFVAGVFSTVNYFIHRDSQIDENKRIRRLMIGSMLRLFLIVIFLGITLFNMSNLSFDFVMIYGISFLLFLFFDILEMRINLRPDLEKSNRKSNA
jgi:uncharacterized membrane protein YiaA